MSSWIDKIDLNLTGLVFTDELHTDVGVSAFELDHDWFWGGADLVIRTASGGGGTLLEEGTDYLLSVEDTDLTTRSGKTVYGKVQIINATYQTGDLYFSGKYIADSIEAEDINSLARRLPQLNFVLIGTGDWPYTASSTISKYYYGTTGASDGVFNLPAASGSGKIIGVWKTDSAAGDIDVTPVGGDLIDGLNSVWKINDKWQYVILHDVASGNWIVLDCLGTLLTWTSSSDIAISSPNASTWYKPSGAMLTVAPGRWHLRSKGVIEAVDASVTWCGVKMGVGDNAGASPSAENVGYSAFAGGGSLTRTEIDTMVIDYDVVLAASMALAIFIWGGDSGALTSLALKGTYGDSAIYARRLA